MVRFGHISVAVPVLGESDTLPKLLECLRRQSIREFSLYVCVNQPEAWHTSPDTHEREAVDDNRRTIEMLAGMGDMDLTVIDRSSRGLGWTEKRKGVGWARKTLFERIVTERSNNEIIVSLDADTQFAPDYLASILDTFERTSTLSAISVPYYHPLCNNEYLNRSLLRYECYMRHYMINMLEIGCPYAFTALGSAMAFRVTAYKKTGGITPLQGGEDFYLMQKLVKCGQVALTGGTVYPQGRISWRVPFGTGPAVAMTTEIQASKYPFYAKTSFLKVKETYNLFPTLFDNDTETPMSAFLRTQLKSDDLWGPLRRNFKSRELFVRACKERIDGLRILQYLRSLDVTDKPPVDFAKDTIGQLDAYRDLLFEKEMTLRNKVIRVGLQ